VAKDRRKCNNEYFRCSTIVDAGRFDCVAVKYVGEVLLRHCEANENVEVRWNKKVVDVGSNGKEAWAVVKNGDGKEERWTADYICGCDGANSAVRKSLFGNEFPGKTWDAQIIATNVPPPSALPFPCY
jgi:2-polyprenyl-6-methoxyphenol hydroxylase-like FAD-dependent oxidoreductase